MDRMRHSAQADWSLAAVFRRDASWCGEVRGAGASSFPDAGLIVRQWHGLVAICRVLNTAHAFAFVRLEIELAVIGQRRKIGLVKRNARSMQENFAADSTNPCADRPVEGDGIGPVFTIVIAHRPPAGIVMERAADAGRFRRVGIAVR